MKTKITRLLEQLGQGLVEREQTLKLAMLTVLAGENLVLVGPPGTGKSLVARRVAQSLSGDGPASHFEYLLTKFSTPEELFGPLSISALKADRFHRNTAGYLPTVRIAFLDEIFKASSSILNALLTILNERVYHNGTEVQPVPLQSLIAASNELPADQEELAALYDRFLVRVFVDYVGTSNLSRLFEPTTEPTLPPQDLLTAQDLAQIRQAANQVVFEPALIQAVQDIWAAHKETFKEDRRERLSDRRLKKVIHLMRVSAATNGRETVDLSDLMLLKDCLWNHADNTGKVRELVLNTLKRHNRQIATEFVAAQHPALAPISVSPGSIVKGYAGSGTENDPLLIQSVEDLMDLTRNDVGALGYFFRQTADLDISGISTWPIIHFKGHYDGAGHTIADRQSPSLRKLFTSAKESNIRRLNISNLELVSSLGETAKSVSFFSAFQQEILHRITCTIIECKASGGNLISSNAENCEIYLCSADKNIIGNTATGCRINSCRSGGTIASDAIESEISECISRLPLIWNQARLCTIKDCLVLLDASYTEDRGQKGCIARDAVESSIERCFVTGKWQGSVRLSGITSSDAQIIHDCVIGNIHLGYGASMESIISNKQRLQQQQMQNNGSKYTPKVDQKLQQRGQTDNNYATDTTCTSQIKKIYQKSTQKDHETISAVRLTQRFFGTTLGWDFAHTWIWDDQANRPTLRRIADSTSLWPSHAPDSGVPKNTTDQLTQQVKANIWL